MRRPACTGFSLIEQIMTLAIVAILIALAVPPLQQRFARTALDTAHSDYIGMLQHARNTAVNEHTRIIACPSRDGQRCADESIWREGWLIGRDPTRAQQPAGAPLYTGGHYPAGLTIVSSEAKHHFWFKSDGSSGGTNQSLLFCMRGDLERVLVIRMSVPGRVKSDVPTRKEKAACIDAANL